MILISPPWPLYNRPSIQLGALKAYLKSRFPSLEIQACHAYLKVAEAVGFPVYQAVSARSWLAETVYAALLFPEKRSRALKLFQRHRSGKGPLEGIDFEALVETAAKATESVLSDLPLKGKVLVGISACLCQLSASLYCIRQIKKREKKILTALGGSSFSGLGTGAFFQYFPEIDFLVHGEGELPLAGIVETLIRDETLGSSLPRIRGVFQKRAPAAPDEKIEFDQVKSLQDLPTPDYDDYFRLLEALDPEKRFFPTLPVETSRGCWWHGRRGSSRGSPKGCAFCNLNLQWRGYRAKDPLQAAAEVDQLTKRHRVLSVALVDNLLSLNRSGAFFERLSSHQKDYHFFCEVRADTPFSQLEAMQKAGVREVQIGIEALSTPLLNKLNKGTTALQNLEIIKHCEALGILNRSNLILHFPGSDATDVAETLRFLEFAAPFRPLRLVSFWLGRGSPAWESPIRFGIQGVKNHTDYRHLFPKALAERLPLMIQGYRGDRLLQKRLWRPVRERVEKWQKDYTRLHEDPGSGPILSFSDGRTFLMLRQRRRDAAPQVHRLQGVSRRIYRFCDRVRSHQEILSGFKGLSEEPLLAFLNQMVEKKLMASEGNRYLSLAVPDRRTGRSPVG